MSKFENVINIVGFQIRAGGYIQKPIGWDAGEGGALYVNYYGYSGAAGRGYMEGYNLRHSYSYDNWGMVRNGMGEQVSSYEYNMHLHNTGEFNNFVEQNSTRLSNNTDLSSIQIGSEGFSYSTIDPTSYPIWNSGAFEPNRHFVRFMGSAGGDLINGIVELSFTGTLAIGPLGGSFEIGVAWDGEKFKSKLSLEHSVGLDASFGGIVNYHSPKYGNLTFDEAEGFSETYNVAGWFIDGTWGGDSPNYNSQHTRNNYNSYGFGISVPLPIGFTRNKGKTWYFNWPFN